MSKAMWGGPQPDIKVPIADLLDRGSSYYNQPWPDVTLAAIDVLTLLMPGSVGRPSLIIFNAPPFKAKLNASGREIRHDGELYRAFELAFHRRGEKIAAISFGAGPHGALCCWFEKEPVSESHAAERGRQLEDEIIEALRAEERRLREQRTP